MELNNKCSGLVVGANLKHLIRESRFKTQERFADSIHCDARIVRRWIKDGVKNLDTIRMLADALDVGFMEFFK